MIRVYLDWNIVSKVRTQREQNVVFNGLYNLLISNTNRLLIPYSSAHLNDLVTSYKKSELGQIETLKDLEFLEKVTENHCLAFNYQKGVTFPEIYNIKEYFNQLNENESYTIENIFNTLDNTPLAPLKSLYFDLLKSTPATDVVNAISNYPDSLKPLKEVFQDTLINGSQFDLLSDTIKMMNKYEEDPDFYRKLRNKSLENLKMNHDYTQEENPIEAISKKLERSPLKKTFKEFVENTVKSINNGKNLTNYDFLVNSYIITDFLGFYKDAKFKNLLQDACHVYYGSYCDYFITDDDNTFNKAKALYNYFSIKTQVYKSSEVNDILEHLLKPNSIDFLEEIPSIVSSGTLLHTEVDGVSGAKISLHALNAVMLDFFNRMQVNQNTDNTSSLIFFKKSENLSNFNFYKEIKAITDKLVGIFGKDIKGRDEYNLLTENLEISENRWFGRRWESINVLVSFCIVEQFGLTLLIKYKI